MVFTRKDGDFHGRTVSFREGILNFGGVAGFLPSPVITFEALQDLGAHHLPLAPTHLRGPSMALRRVDASTTPGHRNIGSPTGVFVPVVPILQQLKGFKDFL